MVVTLKPHQETALNRLKNGCILYGGVGSGKTITSLAYFYTKVCGGVLNDFGSMRRPMDLYVITTAKKRDSLDWEKDAQLFRISTHAEVSVGCVKMTVDSWNNIEKYKDVENAFFIFDEQKVVGSGAWAQAFVKLARKNKWILLSATPGDTWLDYIPVFLANNFYKNRTEFKREHVVYSHGFSKYPKVERYLGVNRLVRHRNDVLVHMPYKPHTVRHIHDVFVDYDEELFEKVVKKRWHVFEKRPIRDIAELFSVMRKVVNSDARRMRHLQDVLSEHPRVIVFYNFDYELEILRHLVAEELCGFRFNGVVCQEPLPCHRHEGLSPGISNRKFEVAEWNGHKHEPIPDTERWVYLVQYAAGAEGWNCTSTDTVVFYSLTYSYKHFEQCQGRIDRMNTPFTDLHYYLFRSRSLIDTAIYKALMSKKSFNESAFINKMGGFHGEKSAKSANEKSWQTQKDENEGRIGSSSGEVLA